MKNSKHPELAVRLAELWRSERHLIVDFLLTLAEFEQRREHITLGYASVFDYLHKELRMPKGTAWRRNMAMQLLRRFPQLAEPLRDGRLSINTLEPLRDVLTEHNFEAVLHQAANRTREENEVLAAMLQPKAPPKDSVRRLRPRVVAFELRPPLADQPALALCALEKPEPDQVQPMSEELGMFSMAVHLKPFMQKLDEVRAALSHKFPEGRYEDLVMEAFEALLKQVNKRKKPAPAKAEATTPAEIERAVRARDENRCQWRLANGEICGSTHRCQLDHIWPKALGGPTTLDNLRVLCQKHNLISAEQYFGLEYMEQFRRNGSRLEPTTS